MLTPEQIAAMKAAAEEGTRLWAAATEGPWFAWAGGECSVPRDGGGGKVVWVEALHYDISSHPLDGMIGDFTTENGENDRLAVFHARNTDYPAMLAAAVNEIERLQSAVTSLAAEFRVAGDEWAAVRLETEIFHKEPTT